MTRIQGILLSCVLAAMPGSLAAWRAMNWHEVNRVSDTVFEVISRPGSGAADFWCGAGDFARRQIGTEATERIYLWRAIGPSVTRPGYKAVQFSLLPPPGADISAERITLSMKAVGDNLTSAAAFQYCLGNDPEDFLRLWP